MTWKIPMPRTAPDEGKAYFRIATKKADGTRMEFYGQLDEKTAGKLMGETFIASRAGKPTKETK